MRFKQFLSESSDYRTRFQQLVASGMLYHATSKASAAKIQSYGFKAGSYFGFNDVAWDGAVSLKVKGKDISKAIFPDPEHLLDHPEISALNLKQISFASVTKKIAKTELFRIFFEQMKMDNVTGIPEGFWLYCDESIPASKVNKSA